MSKQQNKKQDKAAKFYYAYDCCVAWYKERLPHRRIVGDVVSEILKNHAESQRIGLLIPYFTIANLSARRAKQNRNATREIILEMMALPGAPLRILPYNEHVHQWRFTFEIRRDWMQESSPMRPLIARDQVCEFKQWAHKKRVYANTIKIKDHNEEEAKQIHQQIQAMKTLLEIRDNKLKVDAAKRKQMLDEDPDMAAILKRVEAKQRALGIVPGNAHAVASKRLKAQQTALERVSRQLA